MEMGSIDVIRTCLDSIPQIAKELEDGVLYLDAGCLEAFQLMGAFQLLLETGARTICSLENLSPLDAVVDWNSNPVVPAKKVVVLTSRLLSDAHRYILRCLSTHPTVLRCTVFTSISEIAHSAYIDTPLGPDAYREYESLLVQDFEELVHKDSSGKHDSSSSDHEHHDSSQRTPGNRNAIEGGWSTLEYDGEDPSMETRFAKENLDKGVLVKHSRDGYVKLVVSVQHFPMILCPLSPKVFVLPSRSVIAESKLSNHLEDSLGPGLPPIHSSIPAHSEEVPPGATLTAHFLYHMAAKMDLKLEIFSLGGLSKSIGKVLLDMSSLYDVGLRKKTAGLLLVDRTLDILTPCCHGDSLIDRMCSTLPRMGRNCNDLQQRIPESQSKSTSSGIERATLDFRIPLESALDKEGFSIRGSQLSEFMSSFLSGWDYETNASQKADSTDKCDTIKSSDISHSDVVTLDGSFVSSESHLGENFMDALLNKRTKDAAMLVKKWLQETLLQEKVTSGVKIRPGLPTVAELHSMVKEIASSDPSLLRNKGIIQLALATAAAMSETCSTHWDGFASAERILCLSSGDSQTLCSQIHDLISKSALAQSAQGKHPQSATGLLSFKDTILLAITGYILAGENFATSAPGGPFTWEEEHSLKEAIVDAIMECPEGAKFHFLLDLQDELLKHNQTTQSSKLEDAHKEQESAEFDEWGSWEDEDAENNNNESYGDMQLRLELRDRIDNMFRIFHKLSDLKRNSVISEGQLTRDLTAGIDAPIEYGYVHRLLKALLRRQEIPGLEYHSSGVTRFLKSGFGRFGLGQAKPRFGDQNVLLVFIVGGINAREVREAREAVSEYGHPDTELLLGGTVLLTPYGMLDLLLGPSSYH